MIFTRDFVTRENYWQIASLVTQKSLFTVTHALFFIYWSVHTTSVCDRNISLFLTTREFPTSCSNGKVFPQRYQMTDYFFSFSDIWWSTHSSLHWHSDQDAALLISLTDKWIYENHFVMFCTWWYFRKYHSRRTLYWPGTLSTSVFPLCRISATWWKTIYERHTFMFLQHYDNYVSCYTSLHIMQTFLGSSSDI